MDILKNITDAELEMFDTWRTDFCLDNTRSKGVAVKNILKVWADNKARLFDLFNHKLIISKEISFAKDNDQLYRDMDEAINGYRSPANKFIGAWNDLCYHKIRESNYHGDEYEMWSDIADLTSVITLVNNTYHGRNYVVHGLVDEEVKLQTGCKVSKVLGKLAKAFNLPGYEEFRIAHSQALNQKKLTGNLNLSIHPLDYITMSDNECGWGSCMSWRDHGEYRRGTVEMMNSGCVIVAYLTAAEPMRMGKHTWNSKKWRELFVVSQNLIAGIKGYPYCNQNLEIEVLNWLKELAEKNWNYEYEANTSTLYMDDDRVGTTEIGDRTLQVELYTNTMYNDFYSDHCAYLKKGLEDNINLGYSGPEQCMCCGAVGNDFYDSCDLACSYCDEGVYCAECGERIHYEDDQYEIDGRTVCFYCYQDASYCNVCGDKHFDVVDASISHNGLIYNDEFSICWDCRHNNVICDENAWTSNPKRWAYIGPSIYVDFNDMYEQTREKYVKRLLGLTINQMDEQMTGYSGAGIPVQDKNIAASF